MPLDAPTIARICNMTDAKQIAALPATLTALTLAMQTRQMNTPNTRVAMFANIAVESMFDPQAISESATSDPTVPYYGRGLIQLTGRTNYAAIGDKLGVNLLDNPGFAYQMPEGANIAAEYFALHAVNHWADLGHWWYCRYLVNGGYGGLPKYQFYVQEFLNAYWGIKD